MKINGHMGVKWWCLFPLILLFLFVFVIPRESLLLLSKLIGYMAEKIDSAKCVIINKAKIDRLFDWVEGE